MEGLLRELALPGNIAKFKPVRIARPTFAAPRRFQRVHNVCIRQGELCSAVTIGGTALGVRTVVDAVDLCVTCLPRVSALVASVR